MSNVTIQIPDDLRVGVEARAAETGHRTVEQYVESLIRADVEGNGPPPGGPDHLSVGSDEELEALLIKRAGNAEGRDIEATPEFWRDLRARARNLVDGRTGQ